MYKQEVSDTVIVPYAKYVSILFTKAILIQVDLEFSLRSQRDSNSGSD